MPRHGFTLIELLLVLSIIAALAALLLPIISMAKTASRKAKCESMIAMVKSSISLFKDANGMHPEKGYAPIFSDGSGTTTRPSYKLASALDDGAWETVANTLLQQLRTVDRDNYPSLAPLTDPFGGGIKAKVLRFRPAMYYPLRPDSEDPALIDSANPPNPDSYQLWSAGPDGKDQVTKPGALKNDDVTNWKKP